MIQCFGVLVSYSSHKTRGFIVLLVSVYFIKIFGAIGKNEHNNKNRVRYVQSLVSEHDDEKREGGVRIQGFKPLFMPSQLKEQTLCS